MAPLARGGRAAQSFHMVCPSLPGYGFSGKPTEPGWDIHRIARGWAVLMSRLGYDRFVAAGSDWGSSISTSLALQYPRRLFGIHLVAPLAAADREPSDELTDGERAALAELDERSSQAPSPCRPRAQPSRRRFRDRLVAGRPGDSSTPATGANRHAVGTSAPGSNRRYSSTRSGPGSAPSPAVERILAAHRRSAPDELQIEDLMTLGQPAPFEPGSWPEGRARRPAGVRVA